MTNEARRSRSLVGIRKSRRNTPIARPRSHLKKFRLDDQHNPIFEAISGTVRFPLRPPKN
jgi:hypothetical protein